MANVIKIKNSGTAASAPLSLEHGELAINYADGILYYKNSANVIVQLDTAGSQGPQGPTGPQGPQGAIGPQGPQGNVGPQGPQGEKGDQGDAGAQGAIGPQGPQGTTGAQGDIGPQGPQGIAGSQGPQGSTGAQGAQGDIGPQGPTGSQGATGAQGPQGADSTVPGPQGPQGPQGSTGAQGSTNLDGLTDVAITTPEEFQSLTYNGTSWVNSYAPTVTYVRNAEANTLTTGTVVYLFGATGDHASVKRADNDSDTTSSKTIGLVAANILANENGPVVTRGYVDGIDLSVGYASGDILWLGEDGGFTKTKPSAPEHLVFIGVVVRATNNGIIYVATQNGYELDELHNVAINLGTLANGDVVRYNSTSGLWENSQAVGPTGPQGPQGSIGPQGAVGAQGPTGAQGATGEQGSTGVQGPQGDTGSQGSQGPQGAQGNNGATGAQGPQGAQGSQGPQGAQGAASTVAGPQGPQGSQGPQGAQGAQGAQDLDGLTDVTISSSATGQVVRYNGTTWVNAYPTVRVSDNIPTSPTEGQVWYESDTGKLFSYFDSFWIEIGGAVGAQGPTGATGSSGAQGPQGAIGNTGAQGPQGDIGAQGPTGAQGATSDKGGVKYTFSTSTTDADPGNGIFRYNNGTINLVTSIYIDNLDSSGNTQTGWYDTWDDSTNTIEGQLTIIGNPSTQVNVFNVTGSVTVASGYYKIPVSYVSGGSLTNTSSYVILFSRSGDAGPQGATGPQGPSGGPQGATGPQGPQGGGIGESDQNVIALQVFS